MSWLFASHGQITECWSFSFSISPSNEYSGLISFRINWCNLLAVSPRDSQESSPSHLESINSSVFIFLYGPTLTFRHDCWKNYSFDYTIEVFFDFSCGIYKKKFCLNFTWSSLSIISFMTSAFLYLEGPSPLPQNKLLY